MYSVGIMVWGFGSRVWGMRFQIRSATLAAHTKASMSLLFYEHDAWWLRSMRLRFHVHLLPFVALYAHVRLYLPGLVAHAIGESGSQVVATAQTAAQL